ncbi:MAG: sigma-54 interaction domain-containing protein [Planctomycetota bacterium]
MAKTADERRENRVTREHLQAILDSLAEGIVTLDPARQVIGINRAACEILGVDRPEALGSDCAGLFGEHFCAQAARIRQSLAAQKPVENVLAKLQTADGRPRVLNFRTSMLHDDRQQVQGSVVIFRDVTELVSLKEDLARRYRLHNIVGKSKSMQEIFRLIEEVADSDATVLLQGESGTGKELVARAIHQLSPRAEGPFVAVNCSALAEGVLESELFGHVQGAFTGAVHDKRGRFEAAAGGTIFLDEIGDLAPSIQVKLLRVLQERVIERVGSDQSVAIDVRVIAATHRPLAAMVAEGSFRQDLYYRLRVVPLEIPPLRARRDDIPLLAQHFVERFRDETGRPIEGIGEDALALLIDYSWPGNVRELENAIEYAFVKARSGSIEPAHLPAELRSSALSDLSPTQGSGESCGLCGSAEANLRLHSSHGGSAGGPHRSGDAATVHDALQAADWNVAKAARRLGLSRTTLYERISEYGLKRPRE